MNTRRNKIILIIAIIITLIMCCIRGNAQTLKIRKPYYTTVYDFGNQCPCQVTWTIHRSDLGDVKRPSNWHFFNDIRSGLATARHSDFTNSGYQRGHLCPAADRSFDIMAMHSTFSLDNVAPQTPRLNLGTWKLSENWCRSVTMIYDSVQVLVVPIFLDRDTARIGKHNLAVPHAFFKAAWLPANDSIVGTWFVFNK